MVVQRNSPSNTKDAYESIKHQLVACEYKPGERLNVDKLAEQHRLSATPIREILYQLSAEKLVSVIPRTGFFMRSFSEGEIRDLYETNNLVLSGTVRILDNGSYWKLVNQDHVMSRVRMRLQGVDPSADYSLTQLATDLFSVIASLSRNEEIESLIRNLNDRLFFIRVCEESLFGDIEQSFDAICKLLDNSDAEGFCCLLHDYHQARIADIPLLMRQLSKMGTRVA